MARRLAPGGGICYDSRMSTTADHKTRRTTMMAVTTMEEVPVLSEAERAEILASLKKAEAEIAAGQSVQYDSATFRARFIANYHAAKNAKSV